MAHKHGGTNLFTPYSWSFDNLSRVTQFVSADGTSDYSYDKTGQLTAADHDYQSDEAYSYDANGNRSMSGYTTGSNNQLTNDGTYSYTYDGEGNRLTRTNDSSSESTEYSWDFRNRLTKVTDKDSYGSITQVVEYTYDVFNRRIGKAIDTTSPFSMVDAVIERYVYDDANGVSSIDGGNVVLDFVDPDGSGSTAIALSKRYLYGDAVDQLLAQEDVTESISSADRVLWPLVDNLGTVRDLAKNDGTLGEHYTYDSYGHIQSGDTSLTRYLYTSREFDPATGLQYNRARWYDPAVGKWISEDPLGFAAGDANISRYVAGGVTNATDPSGLTPLDFNDVSDFMISMGGTGIAPNTLSFDIPIINPMLRSLGERIGTGVGTVWEWDRSSQLRDQLRERRQQDYVDGIMSGRINVTRPAGILAANVERTVDQFRDVVRVVDGAYATYELAAPVANMGTLAVTASIKEVGLVFATAVGIILRRAPISGLPAPTPIARLLQRDLDHIIARHWPTSSANGAGSLPMALAASRFST